MAMSLKELQNQLSGMQEYKMQDEAALRQQAENVYKPQYEQDLLMLRDSINSNIAQQQRNAVKTGMQRSSYNQAQQAMIRGQGLRAESELGAAYQGNVGSALLNLMNQEKDRKQAADNQRNQLLMAIYEYGRRGSGGNSAGATPVADATDNALNDPKYMVDELLNKPVQAISGINGLGVASSVLKATPSGVQNKIYNNLKPLKTTAYK